MKTNTRYEEALEKARVATQVFHLVSKAYLAREVDDDTFLAAKESYDKAEVEFDQEYAIATT